MVAWGQAARRAGKASPYLACTFRSLRGSRKHLLSEPTPGCVMSRGTSRHLARLVVIYPLAMQSSDNVRDLRFHLLKIHHSGHHHCHHYRR